MVKLKTVTLCTSPKHTWKSKGYIIKGQMNGNGSFGHILFQRGEAKLGLWICVWLSLIDKVMSCYTPTIFNCTLLMLLTTDLHVDCIPDTGAS